MVNFSSFCWIAAKHLKIAFPTTISSRKMQVLRWRGTSNFSLPLNVVIMFRVHPFGCSKDANINAKTDLQIGSQPLAILTIFAVYQNYGLQSLQQTLWWPWIYIKICECPWVCPTTPNFFIFQPIVNSIICTDFLGHEGVKKNCWRMIRRKIKKF